MKIQNNLTPAEWTEKLQLLPEGSRDVYFTPEYHGLHVANGDGTALCAAIENEGHTLLVPGLLTSIPDEASRENGKGFDLQTCNGYGGPVVSANASPDFLEKAWQEWRHASQEQGIVAAFFRLHPLAENSGFLPADAQVVLDRQTVFVDLSAGLEAACCGMDARHRNRVKKGKKEGVMVDWDNPDDWEDFKQLYAEAMDRLNATTSLRFNEKYFEQLRSLKGASLACIREKGKLAAGGIFLFGSRWGHYHLGARTPESDNFLMNSLFQAAIERASTQGLLGVHFGGGRTSAPDDTLLRFKSKLGGRLLDFKVALVIADQERFRRLCTQWAEEAGMPPKWLLGYRQPKPVPVPL